MKLLILFFSAMVLISLVMPPVCGADTLSLAECINIAMENQIDVLVGENDLSSARERRVQVRSDYFPQVSVQYSHDENLSDSSSDDTTSLSVMQNFYDGGLREASVRSADASVAQSGARLDRTRQTVAYSVTRYYFSLLRARHEADVQGTRVLYLEGQLDMMRARIDAGDAAEADTLPVEAELANAKVDKLAADNAVKAARLDLQNAMGMSASSVLEIEEVEEPGDLTLVSLEEYLAEAFDSRPEITESGASVASAKASVDSARISMLPRPFVSGQYDEHFGTGSTVDSEVRIVGGMVFSVFDGGDRNAAYRESRLSLSSAELQAEQTRKDIESDVRRAYLNLIDARERIAASDLSLEAARKNFDAQEAMYKTGLAVPLDLLNAELGLASAKSSAVQARYDYFTSIAELEYAIGKTGE